MTLHLLFQADDVVFVDFEHVGAPLRADRVLSLRVNFVDAFFSARVPRNDLADVLLLGGALSKALHAESAHHKHVHSLEAAFVGSK